MPTFKFTAPDGKAYSVVGPEGASEQQAFQMLQTQLGKAAAPAPTPAPPAKGFGERMNETIADMPRQVGLTARYGLEGVGNALDFVATPFRAAMNAVTPDVQPSIADVIKGAKPQARFQPGFGRKLADLVHLPEPQNANERVVGDVTRMMAGAMVPLKLAGVVAQNTSGTTQSVAQTMAANPIQQLASAGASGAAGGAVRETGGNETSQTLAALAAGVATPYSMAKAQQAGSSIRQMMSRTPPPPAQIDIHINDALRDSGMNLGQLAPNVQASLRRDVTEALRVNGTLSPDAVRRLADYRLTGTTPTAGKLTRDPAQFTQEKNLAKIGANSKDPAAQQLSLAENANNRRLIDLMNETGAGTKDDALAGAQKIIAELGSRNARAKTLIDARYEGARDTAGRSAALDPHAFTNRANNMLDEALLGGKLSSDVRNLLNKAATGDMPLTVDVAEQLKTRIGDLQRASTDAAERKALGMVRSALDDTPLLPGQQIGEESIKAFNSARRLNRAWMDIVDRTPALQAVRDGVEPDKFVRQFITGSGAKSNVADVAALRNSVKSSPQAMGAVKEQIAAHLKAEALSGAKDEVGGVSQSAYNKALDAIGERKLKMFFSQKEVDQLKAIGRVASYEQKQPIGSAVNNSNSGAAIASILDRIGSSSLLSKIPAGKLLAEPAGNIVIGMRAKGALNAPAALVGQGVAPLPIGAGGLMVSPAVLAGDQDEEKKK